MIRHIRIEFMREFDVLFDKLFSHIGLCLQEIVFDFKKIVYCVVC